MKFEFFFFLGAYLILLVAVSLAFRRRLKGLEDFFLASRNLSAFLVFLTLTASWIGATSTLVSIDEAYRKGLSAFWVMGVPAILTVLVFFLFLAHPIRRLSVLTLPDLVELRYGRVVRHLASLLIIWYMVLLASSQMVALGIFLKTFLGLSYLASLILGVSVVFFYSALGGLFTVVVTDGLQLFLLVSGIISLFFFLVGNSSLGEVRHLAFYLGRADYFYFFSDFRHNFLIALSFTLAWTISPIVWQRIQAARSVRKARQGLLAAGGAFFLLYGMIVVIGIFFLALFPGGEEDGPLLASFISIKAGSLLSILLFGAVVAAVMSTMDTAINTGALSLVRDVLLQVHPSGEGKKLILMSRIATLVVAGLAFLVATRFQSILKTLGLASEIMAEGLFIPGMAMLFLRRKMPWAGFLSLALGGGFSILGFLCQSRVLALPWPVWPFSVPYGLAVCLAGFALGAILDLNKA